MTVHVAGRRMLQRDSRIGVVGDRDVETVRFILPRRYGGIDLAAGRPVLLYENAEGQTGVADLDAVPGEDRLVLAWTVGREAAGVPGRLEVRLAITGGDEAWQFCTEVSVFQVARGLTGQGGMVVTPELYAELTALLAERDSLFVDAWYSEEASALTFGRFDGGQVSVPIPGRELTAEAVDEQISRRLGDVDRILDEINGEEI